MMICSTNFEIYMKETSFPFELIKAIFSNVRYEDNILINNNFYDIFFG